MAGRHCRRSSVGPGALVQQSLITAIAVHRPADTPALQKIEGIRNWQVNAFGTELVRLIATLR
ncbi:HRDC domain-containing protein [Desulfosarcina cetonica]|uniref:HRDC domain-containing protein n=1 Tax=Desulfosarcina cetonica TaxID=90730 RepID=UPI00155DBFC3